MTVAQFYTCDICKRPSLLDKDMACRVNVLESSENYMIDICKVCYPYYLETIKNLKERMAVKT